MKDLTESVIDLAELALRFGRVDRITAHPDGQRLETDTDHTVMLGMVACAFADRYNMLPHFGYARLRVGKIAQFALVHDLVEAYAGDTPTLVHMEDDAKAAKTAREHAAYVRISREFTALPWIAETIEEYERNICREARFVKAMDKLMPKACGILNRCATMRNQGMTRESLVARYDEQRIELLGYAGDFPELIALRDDLTVRLLMIWDGEL